MRREDRNTWGARHLGRKEQPAGPNPACPIRPPRRHPSTTPVRLPRYSPPTTASVVGCSTPAGWRVAPRGVCDVVPLAQRCVSECRSPLRLLRKGIEPRSRARCIGHANIVPQHVGLAPGSMTHLVPQRHRAQAKWRGPGCAGYRTHRPPARVWRDTAERTPASPRWEAGGAGGGRPERPVPATEKSGPRAALRASTPVAHRGGKQCPSLTGAARRRPAHSPGPVVLRRGAALRPCRPAPLDWPPPIV